MAMRIQEKMFVVLSAIFWQNYGRHPDVDSQTIGRLNPHLRHTLWIVEIHAVHRCCIDTCYFYK